MAVREYRYYFGLRVNEPNSNKVKWVETFPIDKATDRSALIEARRIFWGHYSQAVTGSVVIATLYRWTSRNLEDIRQMEKKKR